MVSETASWPFSQVRLVGFLKVSTTCATSPRRMFGAGRSGDLDLAKLLDGLEQAVDAQVDPLAAPVDAAARLALVLAGQRLRHLIDGQAVGAQPVRIDLDLDLALEAAADRDRGDAVLRLQARLDLVVGKLEQLVERHGCR